MSNHFTGRAQNALNLSLQAAAELGHTYVGSEHLLLGLLTEPACIAAKLLIARGAEIAKLRAAVVELSGAGARSRVTPADMTPRVRKIIQDSAAEAGRAGQAYVGTEHLLLAILDEPDCVAVRLLEGMGVSPEELRRDVVGFLASSPSLSGGIEPDKEGAVSRGSRDRDSLREARGDSRRREDTDRDDDRIR